MVELGTGKWACQISLGSFQMQSSVCHQYGRPSGGPSKNFSCWLSHVLASNPLKISMWTCLNYLEVPMFRDPEKDRNPTRMACWLNLNSESVTVPIGSLWIHASYHHHHELRGGRRWGTETRDDCKWLVDRAADIKADFWVASDNPLFLLENLQFDDCHTNWRPFGFEMSQLL